MLLITSSEYLVLSPKNSSLSVTITRRSARDFTINFASSHTVGASNSARSGISTERDRGTAPPPASPAASARPARRSCRASRPARASAPPPRSRASTSSTGVRGATYSPRTHRVCFRRRQRLAVDLAVRRQRQRLQHHKRRRHHVIGQLSLSDARAARPHPSPPASAATTYATSRLSPAASSRATTTA